MTVADYLQNMLNIDKEIVFNTAYHNDDTTHKDTDSVSPVLAVRVPKHLNVRFGDVSSQKASVEAHNNDPDSEYLLGMADDLTILAYIGLLIDTGVIVTTSGIKDTDNYYASFFRNILANPLEGKVPSVDIRIRGTYQLRLDTSDTEFRIPTRALVKPKL
jgi:hypothetical protein